MVGVWVVSLVALKSGVVTVPALLQELSAASGLRLTASNEVKNDVLYVNLKPREPQEVLDLIAKADAAEWVKKDGETVLTRSRKLISDQEAADREALARRIRGGIDRLVPMIDLAPWNARNVQAMVKKMVAVREKATNSADLAVKLRGYMNQRYETTIGRLLLRILAKSNASEFSIPAGDTVVFSTGPTPKQRLLRTTSADLRLFEEETKALLGLARRLDSEPTQRGKLAMKFQEPRYQWPTTEFRLIVSRESLRMVHFELTAYGQNHMRIDSGFASIEGAFLGDAYRPPHYDQWKDVAVQPSPAAFGFVRHSDEAEKAAARAAAQKPTETEPIGVMVGDALEQIAKAEGDEEIIGIPDEAAVQGGQQLQQNPKLHEVFDAMAQGIHMEKVGEVTVGSPLWPSVSRQVRADRAKVQNFITDLCASAFLGLRTMVDYAGWTSDLWGLSGLETTLVRAVGFMDSRPNDMLSSLEIRDQYRFYSFMSGVQREAVRFGGRFPFDAVSPAGRAEFEKLMFRRGHRVEPVGVGMDFDFSATATWGNGPPVGLMVSGKEMPRQMVRTVTGPNKMNDMEPGSIGYVLWQQERGEFLDPQLGYPVIKREKFLPFMSVDLELQVASPTAKANMYFADYFGMGWQPLSYQNLPADFLMEIMKVHDHYEKNFPKQSRGNIPPR